jgi:hypothetical protein
MQYVRWQRVSVPHLRALLRHVPGARQPPSSHNRLRVRGDDLDLLLGVRPDKGATASDAHRCNTCDTMFTTGQAIGGHM